MNHTTMARARDRLTTALHRLTWRHLGVAGLLLGLAAPVHGGASPGTGQWTRTIRPGGATWAYTFVVHGPNDGTGGDFAAAPGTGEAVGPRLADALSTTDGVDLEAVRAFLRTGAGTGTDVTVPTVGQAVYLTLRYRVVGPGQAISVSARALIDGTEQCRGTSDATPNTYDRWCNTAWQATAGAHTLRWELDYDNRVAESNEGNNAASTSWTTGTGLDLQAERTYLRTAKNSGDQVTSPQVGQTVYFHFDYAVTAPGTTSPIGLRALLDGAVACSGTHDGRAGAWVQWCADPWVATGGAHTLRWELDFSNAFAEADEDNNAATASWTSSSGVDFQAQRAYFRTGRNTGEDVVTPQVGQSVYPHFDYAVAAPGTSAPIGLRARIDEQVTCSGTHDGRAGAWIQWCADPWVATAGSHTLRWELDHANQFVETNEANNAATKTWTSGGQPCVADCNQDGEVTIDDLITALNVAFDPAKLATCPSADHNGDGEVAIDEIILAVNAALGGCGRG